MGAGSQAGAWREGAAVAPAGWADEGRAQLSHSREQPGVTARVGAGRAASEEAHGAHAGGGGGGGGGRLIVQEGGGMNISARELNGSLD